MEVFVKGSNIFVDKKSFFIQGMNLFLDPQRLEENPRKIYTPHIASEDLIVKIIGHLKDTKINTVRIWPTIVNNKHISSIPSKYFQLLYDANLKIILNLPVNWNLKPKLSELKEYLIRYSTEKYPNILMYCINNEAYHGFFSPFKYTKAVNQLTHRLSNRPTLLTNANLNYPWHYCADVIGADFFFYKYSIARDGIEDIGTVAQMFFEDASKVYKIFPKFILKFYPFVVRYMKKKAIKSNISFKKFQLNFLKVLKGTKKANKPFIVAEYGYTEDPKMLEKIYSYLPIKSMQGHIWYNWINFDENIDGNISNVPLFEKFKEICERLENIKKKVN